MKPRYTFQTLILAVLVPVLAAFTAIWSWQLYRSTHRIILDGFDRKLLAVSGSVASLLDADSHRDYQHRYRIAALTTGPAGRLLGYAIDRRALVAINPLTGGAHTLAPAAAEFRSLATPAGSGIAFGLGVDGRTLAAIDTATGESARAVQLPVQLDGIYAAAGGLAGWRGTAVYRIDPATGTVVASEDILPESLRAIATDPASGQQFGLSADGQSLVALASGAQAARRVALVTPAKPVPDGAAAAQPSPTRPAAPLSAIVWSDGRLAGAGVSLVTIDPARGEVSQGNFTAGYFDVDAPFYRANRASFTTLQKAAGLTYLYTQVYLGEKRIYYVLDGTTTADYSRPGSGDELPAATVEGAERVQFLGQPWVSPIQQWEPWGLLKSGFSPVRDSAGRVIAMAGADVDITIIQARVRWALFAALSIGVVSLLAASVVAFRVARSLTRPLEKLKESALWIAAGYYGAEIKAAGPRELATLAGRLDDLRRRLDEEGRRVLDWQDTLRSRRDATALTQTLDETMAGLSGNEDGAEAMYRRGSDKVWWLASPDADPVAIACTRVRMGVLARELLHAGLDPADLPELLLASAPDLVASACWQENAQTLHYRARSPVAVSVDGTERRLEGAGRLRFLQCLGLRWMPPPAVPTPGGETKGPA